MIPISPQTMTDNLLRLKFDPIADTGPSSPPRNTGLDSDLRRLKNPQTMLPSPQQSWGSFGFGGFDLGNLISQLMQLLQSILASLSGGDRGSGQGAHSDFFRDAQASSSGDPHLAFSGHEAGGRAREFHYDSMRDHRNLLSSDSFRGGYRIATTETRPGRNSATTNERVSVETDFGRTAVSLDRYGQAEVRRHGQPVSLARGQTLALGFGETVTENADGSLRIVDRNRQGGSITTDLRSWSSGVDVSSVAENVDLSGELFEDAPQKPAS